MSLLVNKVTLKFSILFFPLLTLHFFCIHHPSIESSLCSVHAPIHPSIIRNLLFCLSLPLRLLSLQERSDYSSPSPTSSSTFYYPLDPELHHPQSSSSTASAGPQPHTGHAPPGQLPGPAPVEAEWRPVRDDAPPLGALPPVTAGDGAVFQVVEENESPWKRRSEIARLGFVDSGGGEELKSRTTENSDLQMTLI